MRDFDLAQYHEDIARYEEEKQRRIEEYGFETGSALQKATEALEQHRRLPNSQLHLMAAEKSASEFFSQAASQVYSWASDSEKTEELKLKYWKKAVDAMQEFAQVLFPSGDPVLPKRAS